jgi:dihydrofolate reductase
VGPVCSLVVAASTNDVIGDAGDLPWHLPGDLRAFKRHTTGHVLVAGRATQDSIVARLGHGLPQRTTLILSRDPSYTGPDVVRSFEEARQRAADLTREQGLGEWFVIGGASVYAAALGVAGRVHLTRVHAEVDGDTVLPAGWLDRFARQAVSEPHEDDGIAYTFETWERR